MKRYINFFYSLIYVIGNWKERKVFSLMPDVLDLLRYDNFLAGWNSSYMWVHYSEPKTQLTVPGFIQWRFYTEIRILQPVLLSDTQSCFLQFKMTLLWLDLIAFIHLKNGFSQVLEILSSCSP